MPDERETLEIDVLFVGGGPAGLAGAYQGLFWKRVQTRWAHTAAAHAR